MTAENQPMEAASSRASSGLLMIGAGVVVAAWIVFALLLGEYTFSAFYVGLAAVVLFAILGIGGFSLSAGAQRGIGLFMGVVAIMIVLIDLRFGDFPDGFVDVLAYLAYIGGGILMLVGARGLKA